MSPAVNDVLDEIAQVDPDYAKAVKRFEVQVKEDSTGDPAIFVTIVLKSRGIRAAWPKREPFRETIEERLSKNWPERFPYVTFSAESVWIDPQAPAPA